MIEYVPQGNILHSDAAALVNPVNCNGVMGKGLAAQFKDAFPKMFPSYKEMCVQKALQPGLLHVYWLNPRAAKPKRRAIVNFPTKRHHMYDSRLVDIKSGLVALKQMIIENEIPSIAIPKLGCGEGKLRWDVVRKEIEAALNVPELKAVRIIVYGEGK